MACSAPAPSQTPGRWYLSAQTRSGSLPVCSRRPRPGSAEQSVTPIRVQPGGALRHEAGQRDPVHERFAVEQRRFEAFDAPGRDEPVDEARIEEPFGRGRDSGRRRTGDQHQFGFKRRPVDIAAVQERVRAALDPAEIPGKTAEAEGVDGAVFEPRLVLQNPPDERVVRFPDDDEVAVREPLRVAGRRRLR